MQTNAKTCFKKRVSFFLDGGYVLQYVSRANPSDFVRINWLREYGLSQGFASFRHAACCMTIFYPEVQMKFEANRQISLDPV